MLDQTQQSPTYAIPAQTTILNRFYLTLLNSKLQLITRSIFTLALKAILLIYDFFNFHIGFGIWNLAHQTN